VKDTLTYEVLENYKDLFYLHNYKKWFVDLLSKEKNEEITEHLKICLNICNRKLKGSFYESI
jgi:hypothetical protein